MIKTTNKIGVKDQGRRMSLRDFEPVEVQEGYIFELSRGIVTASDHFSPARARQMERTEFWALEISTKPSCCPGFD